MVFEFGSGSGNTERGPLIVPRRAADVSVRAASLPSIAGLPPIENRVGDIRREIAEADKTSEIGRAHAFAIGLNQSRARSADRARQAADVSARGASLPANRAAAAHRGSPGSYSARDS